MIYKVEIAGGRMDGETITLVGSPEAAADLMMFSFVVQEGASVHHGLYRRGMPTIGWGRLRRRPRITLWRYELIEERYT